MFLEQMMQNTKIDQTTRDLIKLIISQLNFLLCMVNDILDMKLIQQDKFNEKVEDFCPTKALEFIVAIFTPQSIMQKTKISFETISADTSRLVI